jgi:SAM-dependent methyltransferase
MPTPPDTTIRFEIRLDETADSQQSRTAYDAIYQEGDISQTDSFYQWVLAQLALQPHERYLDISCGRAQLANKAQSQGIAAYGLDLSHTALVSGRTAPNPAHLVTGNSQALPFGNESFEVISNIGSVEHYVDMELAIREMARVLAKNGRAFILVPNTYSLLHNILLAYKEGRSVVDVQPIQRYAARQEWADMLEANGLQVIHTGKYEIETPRTKADWQLYVRHPKKLVRLALRPFVPTNLAFCFLFTCRKA